MSRAAMCVCVHMYTYIHMYIIYICIHLFMYIYIHTHARIRIYPGCRSLEKPTRRLSLLQALIQVLRTQPHRITGTLVQIKEAGGLRALKAFPRPHLVEEVHPALHRSQGILKLAHARVLQTATRSQGGGRGALPAIVLVQSPTRVTVHSPTLP